MIPFFTHAEIKTGLVYGSANVMLTLNCHRNFDFLVYRYVVSSCLVLVLFCILGLALLIALGC